MSERVIICGGAAFVTSIGLVLVAVSLSWGMDADDNLFFLTNGERMTIPPDTPPSECPVSIGLGSGMDAGPCWVPRP